MHGPFFRRSIRALPLIAVLILAACGDARVRKLGVGMTRDSALKILALDTPTPDSLPHVYRSDRYLINGMTEIWFYTPTRAKAPKDTVPEKDLTPIVMHDGKLTGWGWAHYDSVAKALGILVRPR
jgi:hypothetical protein